MGERRSLVSHYTLTTGWGGHYVVLGVTSFHVYRRHSYAEVQCTWNDLKWFAYSASDCK